jgi:hypothetical protein
MLHMEEIIEKLKEIKDKSLSSAESMMGRLIYLKQGINFSG